MWLYSYCLEDKYTKKNFEKKFTTESTTLRCTYICMYRYDVFMRSNFTCAAIEGYQTNYRIIPFTLQHRQRLKRENVP